MNNNIRNSLTEHKQNFRLINPHLMDCYAGLTPNSLTKISFVLFNFLLNTKRYYKADSRHYTEEEDKRIYTNVVLKPKDIVKRCNPVKVYTSDAELENDASNLVKKLNELDDMNIFYVWKCGYPHVIMFIMERDIGSWKFYNPSGYVIPRTMKKIITYSPRMISSMNSMLKSQNQFVNEIDLNTSYGQFINRMIGKMNPSVHQKIKKWEPSMPLDTYLSELLTSIKVMDPFEGMVEDENFLTRLPPNVSEKLKAKPKEITVHNPILEKEIIPKNDNIITIKSTIKEEKAPVIHEKNILVQKESIKATAYVSETIDPFRNCNEFIKFYRKSLMVLDSNAKFFSLNGSDSERKIASEILDLLITSGKNNDITFLKSWISYYKEVYLKGNNIEDVFKTSLKALKTSFNEYSIRYIG